MNRSRLTQALALAVAATAAGCTSDVGQDKSAATSLTSSPAMPARTDATSPTEMERTWSLTMLDDAAIAVSSERARPSLLFDPKANRVSGMAGVNRFAGPYVLGPGTLKLGPLMATKMAGPPEMNELETRFLRALERVTAWRIERGELELLSGEQVLARFTRKTDAP